MGTHRPGSPPAAPGLLEYGGVVILGLGSCLLPVVGTIAGLIMIGLSRWWTVGQKVVAILLSLSGAVVVPLVAGAALMVRSGGGAGPAPIVDYVPVEPAVPTTPR